MNVFPFQTIFPLKMINPTTERIPNQCNCVYTVTYKGGVSFKKSLEVRSRESIQRHVLHLPLQARARVNAEPSAWASYVNVNPVQFRDRRQHATGLACAGRTGTSGPTSPSMRVPPEPGDGLSLLGITLHSQVVTRRQPASRAARLPPPTYFWWAWRAGGWREGSWSHRVPACRGFLAGQKTRRETSFHRAHRRRAAGSGGSPASRFPPARTGGDRPGENQGAGELSPTPREPGPQVPGKVPVTRLQSPSNKVKIIDL